jgi:hypothetical protein
VPRQLDQLLVMLSKALKSTSGSEDPRRQLRIYWQNESSWAVANLYKRKYILNNISMRNYLFNSLLFLCPTSQPCVTSASSSLS